ncbi:MAG TPA: hypothetical protein VF603_11900 [Allosphingosinicella sp.]|jgi:hypothetical protein
MPTFESARDFHGPKLYQQRAREVLPILVRQAGARQPVFYEALAREVGMPNPRNLNYVLGCIGRTLNELAEEWEDHVPPIEALVVNQQTRLPGPGFDGFLTEQGETWSTKAERRALIEAHWARIYAYPYWREVLDELEVEPTVDAAADIIARAGRTGGGGEGPDHLALKELVRRNPHLVGLAFGDAPGEPEFCLPSGDSVDVIFFQKRRIHAVEVKPAGAADSDIARGLFQCVKYRSVLQALAAYEHDQRKITVCLALGRELPPRLIPLRNSLNIDVFESLAGRE